MECEVTEKSGDEKMMCKYEDVQIGFVALRFLL
jgi:hypothetical protein